MSSVEEKEKELADKERMLNEREKKISKKGKGGLIAGVFILIIGLICFIFGVFEPSVGIISSIETWQMYSRGGAHYGRGLDYFLYMPMVILTVFGFVSTFIGVLVIKKSK